MDHPPVDLLRGTLNLLILKALAGGPEHGYGVARWIEHATKGALQIEEGPLYPALHRLEDRGQMAAEWGVSDNNRRARFYRLTPEGRRRLKHEAANWTRLARAVFAALEASPRRLPAEA